jgi:Uncharacterized protein conserved in bacteria (DUF2252)
MLERSLSLGPPKLVGRYPDLPKTIRFHTNRLIVNRLRSHWGFCICTHTNASDRRFRLSYQIERSIWTGVWLGSTERFFGRHTIPKNEQAIGKDENAVATIIRYSHKNQCPRWESNPHGPCGPTDFKSVASAVPPRGRMARDEANLARANVSFLLSVELSAKRFGIRYYCRCKDGDNSRGMPIMDNSPGDIGDIRIATRSFERWLGNQVSLVRGDLRFKHVAMKADPFSFLRASYYRWAQQFMELDATTSRAAIVLGVGDLHLENFGTWRDGLGRLAWGINDFDEAFPLPFTNDLVRLATSALVAIEVDHLRLGAKAACRAIWEGYREGIETGGRPFVIGEEHRWFKPILQSTSRDPGLFWDRLRQLPCERSALPAQARAAIEEVMPARDVVFDVRHRVAGLGNLGKARYTAIAQWQGGPVAREAKALTLSAAAWAQSKMEGPYYGRILADAVRSPDPYLKVHDAWVVRRLAPDCRRLETAALSAVEDEEGLLYAMGFETANVHLGTAGARRSIGRQLEGFSKKELRNSATEMKDALTKDFRRWRKGD